MLRSTGLLRVTILDVVVPGACRDIFSGSRDTLSKDHSWTLRLVISPLTVSTSQSIFAGSIHPLCACPYIWALFVVSSLLSPRQIQSHTDHYLHSCLL